MNLMQYEAYIATLGAKESTLKELQWHGQYYLTRDEFVRLFKKYAPAFYELWCNDNTMNFNTYEFNFMRNEDEFYIFHYRSGVCLNWYKHLGRTNTINKYITKNTYIELLEELNEDIELIKNRR